MENVKTANQLAITEKAYALANSNGMPSIEKMLNSKNAAIEFGQSITIRTGLSILDDYAIARQYAVAKREKLHERLEPVRVMGKLIKWTFGSWVEEFTPHKIAQVNNYIRVGENFLNDDCKSVVKSLYPITHLNRMFMALKDIDDNAKRVDIIKHADDIGVMSPINTADECAKAVKDFTSLCEILELSPVDCEKEIFAERKHKYESEQFNKRAQEIHDNGGIDNAEKAEKVESEKAEKAEKVKAEKAEKESTPKAVDLGKCKLKDLEKLLREIALVSGTIAVTSEDGKAYVFDIVKD